MTVQLNHTIVQARDKKETAAFLVEILGLPEPTVYGPFLVVQVSNDVSLDVIDDPDGAVHPQHYAFLVSEPEFDDIFGRIRERGLPYWADPFHRQPGETNTTTAVGASTGRTRTATTWRSSPAPTAVEADRPAVGEATTGALLIAGLAVRVIGALMAVDGDDHRKGNLVAQDRAARGSPPGVRSAGTTGLPR